MKYALLIFFGLIVNLQVHAQDLVVPEDDKYVEDQVYVGVLYNSIAAPKAGIENVGFPYTIEAGFVKDIPINTKRNKAIGVGLGYQYDVLKPSVAMKLNDADVEFTTVGDFSQFEYRQHQLVIPIAYRWRTSTPSKFTFWRFYGGLAYLHTFKNTVFYKEGAVDNYFKNTSGIYKDKLALHTSIGYGTWNLYAKYYLSPYFKNKNTLEGKSLEINQLQLGLVFYML